MSRLTLETCSSLTDFRQRAGAWDDLWQRSNVAFPVTRAEAVADWAEAFYPRARFDGLMVADGGQRVAGLALFGQRLGRVVPAAMLANDLWFDCGDLLVDPHADVAAALDLLVGAIARLPTTVVWLDPLPLDAPRWQALIAAAERHGFGLHEQPKWEIGTLEVAGTWADYEASWSGNHRRHMRKALKRAERAGRLELKVFDRPSPAEIPDLVRRGFEIEDRSWKGSAGSSVLRSGQMLDFYIQQARLVAGWGQLRLVFLELDGRPIAFELGYAAKGTYFSPKVGYDAQFAEFSPGQLLRYLLFERFFATGEFQTVDFWGPVTEATAKWSTNRYRVGRLLLTPPTWPGRGAMAAYRLASRMLRAGRTLGQSPVGSNDEPSTCPPPEAEPALVHGS